MVDIQSTKRATLHDVADRAGVSYQTVSRVINQHPNVADKTRQKVLQAIRELDYRPNQAAKVLATGKSYMLHLIMFDLRYSDPLPSMLFWAKQMGYTLVISEISPSATKSEVRKTLQDLTSRMIDGLIMFTPYIFISYDEMKNICREVPFVFVSTELGVRTPTVAYDQAHGTVLAVQHLLDLGHQHIAEIRGLAQHSDARIRHETFIEMLRRNDIKPGPSVEGDFEIVGGYRATQQLLATQEPFTAILVGNDRMALGALHALREHNLRVPEDVSIIGYDDMTEAAYFSPPLTTIKQDLSVLAQQSIDYLVSMVKNPNTPIQQRVLYPELIIRNSTAPLKQT